MRLVTSSLLARVLASLGLASLGLASLGLASLALASLALSLASTAAAQVHRPLPVVQRLEPSSGPPGTEVSMVGRHFDPRQTVWLGETELEITGRMPSRWSVRIPNGAASGNIEIRTDRGNVRGPRFRVSRSGPTPVINAISPSAGPPGSEVEIRGDNFSPRLTDNQVYLGAQPVVVRSATPTTLTVIVPGEPTEAHFRVEVSGAGSVESEETFTPEVGTAIASFEPALGPPGSRVTLRGTGFSRAAARNRVYVGERRARVRRASETELEVEIPRRAERGRFLVDVRGGGRAYSGTEFDVRYPPAIAGMEPSSGAPGTRVTLTGEHFGTDVRQVTAVIGETALPVRDIAEDRLVVEIPQGAASGPIDVTAATLGPAHTRQPFTVLVPVSIASFEPRSGGAGQLVTIQGAGFAAEPAGNTVTISGHALEVVQAAADSLSVRIPDGLASGPLSVAVANAGEARTTQPFVVTRAPSVASFEPASGPPGTVVTLHGQNFGTRQGLIDVRLGVLRAELRRASETELQVVVPEGAHTARFRVLVRLQGAADSNEEFTVTTAGATPPAEEERHEEPRRRRHH